MNLNATLLGQMIAFGLFVWFCWKFVWPPLLAAMEERAQKIEQGLKDSEESAKKILEAEEESKKMLTKAKNEAKAKGERGLADPLPDRDKDGNLTNPLEIEKRKLMKQKKAKTAQIDKASGFKAKQPLIKQKQRIQQKINDINRKLDR